MFTGLSTQSGAQKQEETPPLLPEKVQGRQTEAAQHHSHSEELDDEENTTNCESPL